VNYWGIGTDIAFVCAWVCEWGRGGTKEADCKTLAIQEKEN
jgi:hypothetical protein